MEELFEKLKAEPPVNRVYKKNDSRRESLPTIKAAPMTPPINKCRSLPPINSENEIEKEEVSVSPVESVESDQHPESNKKPEMEVHTSNVESPKRQMPTKAQQKLFEPIAEMRAKTETDAPKAKNIAKIKKSQNEKTENGKNETGKPEKVAIKSETETSITKKTVKPGKTETEKAESEKMETGEAETEKKETETEELLEGTADKSESEKNETGKTNTQQKVRSCKVRIKRDDLHKLQEQLEKTKKSAKKSKLNKEEKKEKSDVSSPPKTATKRKGSDANSPPKKKGRHTKESSPKKSTGFFIKLNNTIPSAKKSSAALNNKRSKSQSPITTTTVRKTKLRTSEHSLIGVTKATKFTRTQLIKNFGKRFFTSIVKIKKCKHPLMLSFECDARERKHQAKNKSKKLSVSFKEQVEIIGDSDTESNYSDENNAVRKHVATPARPKKVENGKILDDDDADDLDSSVFVNDDVGSNSSTPLRKKTEKKSYSPLKDDSAPSAKSEQLKLANEKLPCGLRRLMGAPIYDEDDDDDESEYIVPIDITDKKSLFNRLYNIKLPTSDSAKEDVEEDDNDDEVNIVNENINAKNKSQSVDEEDVIPENNGNKKHNKKKPSNNDTILEKESKNSSVTPKTDEKTIENGKENLEIKDPERIASKENETECTNGNGKTVENVDSLSKGETAKSKEPDDEEETDSMDLVQENDSPIPSSHNTLNSKLDEKNSDSPLKSALDKLTGDGESSNINNTTGGKEQNTSVKSTKITKKLCISA